MRQTPPDICSDVTTCCRGNMVARCVWTQQETRLFMASSSLIQNCQGNSCECDEASVCISPRGRRKDRKWLKHLGGTYFATESVDLGFSDTPYELNLSRSLTLPFPGDLAPHLGRPLVGVFLQGTKDADQSVRASSLSNMGELCQRMNYALGPLAQEVRRRSRGTYFTPQQSRVQSSCTLT